MEQVGVVVVHGIGEQARFEHLDAETRGLINAIRRTGASLTVEIMSSRSAAFHAAQESWEASPGPAVRLFVKQGADQTCINIHEVWWADVNEATSLAKQARFWLWGLSVWAYPSKRDVQPSNQSVMFSPRPADSERAGWLDKKELRVRSRLFGVGCVFLMASLTLGFVSAALKRLLDVGPLNVVTIFANYLSSIKLFSQPHRGGGGWRDEGGDFLDTIGEPPRVSIRRRMIRTIADVACQPYDRWYILGHSQGSVVAFNGLMENGFTWLGYLDEQRWARLQAAGLAGASMPGAILPDAAGQYPARPLWAPANGVVYRRRIFAKFRGFLSYGCPLEKFAAIWPGKVPVCREPGFEAGTRWLNVFDPLDPVSGRMRSWPTADPLYCPPPENVGYATAGTLLLGHLRYLTCPTPDQDQARTTLADRVASWLLSGTAEAADAVMAPNGPRFFPAESPRARRREVSAWLQWSGAFTLATIAGAVIAVPTTQWVARRMSRKPPIERPAFTWRSLCTRAAVLTAGVMVGTFAVGACSWLLSSEDKRAGLLPDEPFSGVAVPPDPPSL